MSKDVITVESLAEELAANTLSAVSEFGLRNEKLQQRSRPRRFGRLKKELKKKSRLLPFKEIAAPFNPADMNDLAINEDRKWRPSISARKAKLLMKFYAEQLPETKAELLKRAGRAGQEWDTSDRENLNDLDNKILNRYLVPRIFSIPTANSNDQRISQSEYGISFAVDVTRDEDTGALVGEMPVFLQVNKVYRELWYEEKEEIEKAYQAAKAGKSFPPLRTRNEFFKVMEPNLAMLPATQFEEAVRDLRNNIIISDDVPYNSYLMVEIPLDNTGKFKDVEALSTITAEELDKMVVYVKQSKEMRETFEKFEADWAENDVHDNFLEFDMNCPNSVADDSRSEALKVGAGTRYFLPNNSHLANQAWFNHFDQVLDDYLTELRDVELRYKASVNVSQYTEEVDRRLLRAIEDDRLLQHPYMTKKIMDSNRSLLSRVFDLEFEEEEMNVMLGDSKLADGEDNSEAAAAEARVAMEDKVNNSSEVSADVLDLDSITGAGDITLDGTDPAVATSVAGETSPTTGQATTEEETNPAVGQAEISDDEFLTK